MLAAIPRPTMAMPTWRLKSFWTYNVSWPHDTHVVTIPRLTRDSFMKTWSSALHCGHLTRSAREGGISTSSSQARHLKCIIGVMKPLIVVLLLAISVQAQTPLVDAARKERER